VARVEREVDSGSQAMELPLPAVVTADLRLNTPRYAALPKIMAARKRPIERKSAGELGVDVTPRLRVLTTEEPPKRKSGEIVGSVTALVDKLKAAGVIGS
jgi:electron transfer flavoprotein beta subunit